VRNSPRQQLLQLANSGGDSNRGAFHVTLGILLPPKTARAESPKTLVINVPGVTVTAETEVFVPEK